MLGWPTFSAVTKTVEGGFASSHLRRNHSICDGVESSRRGAALNKVLSVVSICLAVAFISSCSGLGKGSTGNPPSFNTPYQAVLLDNGQVYYGKLSRLGTEFPEMTDVYYIVNTQDPQTKTVKHVLVKRGKELHAPTETFFNARHIVMIEPVGPGSEVAKLISQSESQSQK